MGFSPPSSEAPLQGAPLKAPPKGGGRSTGGGARADPDPFGGGPKGPPHPCEAGWPPPPPPAQRDRGPLNGSLPPPFGGGVRGGKGERDRWGWEVSKREMKLLKSHSLLSIVNSYVIDSPSPSNISYLWNYGSLLGVCLGIQIITGVTLAMHYTSHVDLAFISVEHIMRDVNFGWLIRYTHANVASFFFIFVYIHIGKGLYYGSYKRPRILLWSIGVIIFIVMMGTAFLGYTLVWGTMSFWGATVITNLLSAIPVIGGDLVNLIWGGFSVDNPTLNRFFSLHYLLPFVLAALAVMHVIAQV